MNWNYLDVLNRRNLIFCTNYRNVKKLTGEKLLIKEYCNNLGKISSGQNMVTINILTLTVK